MYEKPSSHFFKTTTGIQSGLDDFDESRLITTFLTILVVTEILCSFTFLLEEETDEEISDSARLESFKKFLANNINLSDAEDISRP